MKYTIYQVFKAFSSGINLKEFDTLEEAEKEALKWSMNEIDRDVIIIKIEKDKIKTFRNGKEVA